MYHYWRVSSAGREACAAPLMLHPGDWPPVEERGMLSSRGKARAFPCTSEDHHGPADTHKLWGRQDRVWEVKWEQGEWNEEAMVSGRVQNRAVMG